MPAVVAVLPYVAAAAAVAGGGVAAYSSYESGQSQAALARYNAAQQQAQDQAMLEQTEAKSLAQRQEGDKILAQQQAAYAAQGVVVNTGSPLTVRSNQASLLEMRALDTEYGGELAYRSGQSEAYGDEMQASAAQQAGDLGAASNLLQGAGSAAKDIYG